MKSKDEKIRCLETNFKPNIDYLNIKFIIIDKLGYLLKCSRLKTQTEH